MFGRYVTCTLIARGPIKQLIKDAILAWGASASASSLRVIVATIAFGVGINCSDVRQIIHWGVPDDEEMYFEETGRAGRGNFISLSDT